MNRKRHRVRVQGRLAQLAWKYLEFKEKDDPRNKKVNAIGRFAQLIQKYRLYCIKRHRLRVMGKWSKLVRKYLELKGNDENVGVAALEVKEESNDDQVSKGKRERRLMVLGKLAQLLRRYALRRFAEQRLERLTRLARLARKYLIRHKKLTKLRAQHRWTTFARRLLYPEKQTGGGSNALANWARIMTAVLSLQKFTVSDMLKQLTKE